MSTGRGRWRAPHLATSRAPGSLRPGLATRFPETAEARSLSGGGWAVLSLGAASSRPRPLCLSFLRRAPWTPVSPAREKRGQVQEGETEHPEAGSRRARDLKLGKRPSHHKPGTWRRSPGATAQPESQAGACCPQGAGGAEEAQSDRVWTSCPQTGVPRRADSGQVLRRGAGRISERKFWNLQV